MLKKTIKPPQEAPLPLDQPWLNLEELVTVEITSEDPEHPIEHALLPEGNGGWRAAEPGKQTIRLLFNSPQQIRLIRLNFVETKETRTQEYLLRWSANDGQTFHEIVRQQWNFNPDNSTREVENYQVNLNAVTVFELIINPDISGGNACASLEQLSLA